MKIKMKKITAGRGVLLAMALSLTFVLSTLYVVPVAGRTEVAVEASRTKSSRAEETNVPSFKIDGFVENETRASLSSSSSSSLEEKKKSASKRSKSSVANDSSAPMTKMPSSTTTVEPAVAGETDDLSEGFIRKGEIFAPANAAAFEGNDEIVALGKDDNDLVDDSSLEVLKVEDPLVEFRKSDFVEKFDMSKNVHRIEPLDENGPLPSDYVPPESKITEDEFRAEFDARFNNMTEAEAMLGAGKNETSALGAWIYQGQYHSHTNWHREITGWGYALGGCSAICGPYGWRTDGRKYRDCATHVYYHRYQDFNCYSSGWWWWYRSWCTWGSYHYKYSHSSSGSCSSYGWYQFRSVGCNRHACPPPPSPPPPGASAGTPQVSIAQKPVILTDYEFDFQISVSDDGCYDPSNCFRDDSTRAENSNRGLVCQAYVKKKDDSSCGYAKSEARKYPCLRWDNFFDSQKSGAGKVALTLTNENNEKVVGHMQIWHHCFWKYPDGTIVPQTSKNKFELLHEFEAVKDCGHWAPASVNTPNNPVISTIARKFLLSSPTFLASNCDDVVSSREAVFREFDKYPLDGKLSFDEIERAFLSHDVDVSYLNHLQNTGLFEDVLLSQVILSPTFPFLCIPKDPVPEVVVNKITYPVMDTQEEECAANNEKLDLEWDYNLGVNKDRDFACVYADGLLYRKIPGKEMTEPERESNRRHSSLFKRWI